MPLGLKLFDYLQREETKSLVRTPMVDPIGLFVANNARLIDDGYIARELWYAALRGVDLVNRRHSQERIARSALAASRFGYR